MDGRSELQLLGAMSSVFCAWFGLPNDAEFHPVSFFNVTLTDIAVPQQLEVKKFGWQFVVPKRPSAISSPFNLITEADLCGDLPFDLGSLDFSKFTFKDKSADNGYRGWDFDLVSRQRRKCLWIGWTTRF